MVSTTFFIRYLIWRLMITISETIRDVYKRQAVKRMKQAFNLCSSSEKFSDEDKDYIHFYCAVRSIIFKLTKGDAPDIEQMNARVRKMLEPYDGILYDPCCGSGGMFVQSIKLSLIHISSPLPPLSCIITALISSTYSGMPYSLAYFLSLIHI